MKRLLSNSLIGLFLLSLTYCASNKNNTTDKQETKINQGNTVLSQSSDTTNSKNNTDYKKTEIKHNAPNQSKIDSIKKAKTKKKK